MKKERLNRVEKSALLSSMFDSALAMLREHPVMRIAHLEAALGKKYRADCERIAGKLQSGRVEWLNLVDWVKARLTRRGLIRYFSCGEERYLCFMESCGHVNGTDLVARRHANDVISDLILLLATSSIMEPGSQRRHEERRRQRPTTSTRRLAK